MTTATPAPAEPSAVELTQSGDKRWIGPLDRQDPKIDERLRLPRQGSAVAEAAYQLQKESFLEMITRTIAAIHDWLAGPPTSEQQRVQLDIIEHQNLAHYGTMGNS